LPKTDCDAGNFAFAFMVGYLRNLFARMNFAKSSASASLITTQAYLEARQRLEDLRARIAQELTAAMHSGEIRLRRQFIETTDAYVGSQAFITTNWDLLLEAALLQAGAPEPRVVHIHGDIGEPKHLLLPMEVVHEPYRDLASVHRLETKFQTVHLFHRAKSVVIYGLSMSPLDAEIGQVLRDGLTDSMHSGVVHVHDLPGAAEEVAARVGMVLPIRGSSTWTVNVHHVGTAPSADAAATGLARSIAAGRGDD